MHTIKQLGNVIPWIKELDNTLGVIMEEKKGVKSQTFSAYRSESHVMITAKLDADMELARKWQQVSHEYVCMSLRQKAKNLSSHKKLSDSKP